MKGTEGLHLSSSFSFSAGGFFKSRIIQEKLITSLVPFLPLSRRHVERCVRSQLCSEGLCSRSDVVEAVGGAITYTPVQGHFFSSTGCKAVPAKINLFLWVEEQRVVNRKGGSYLWKDKGLPTLGALTSKQDSETKTHPGERIKENRTQKTQLSSCFWNLGFFPWSIGTEAVPTHLTVSLEELDFTWKHSLSGCSAGLNLDHICDSASRWH